MYIWMAVVAICEDACESPELVLEGGRLSKWAYSDTLRSATTTLRTHSWFRGRLLPHYLPHILPNSVLDLERSFQRDRG